jgi:hypothetical protein
MKTQIPIYQNDFDTLQLMADKAGIPFEKYFAQFVKRVLTKKRNGDKHQSKLTRRKGVNHPMRLEVSSKQNINAYAKPKKKGAQAHWRLLAGTRGKPPCG